MGAGNRLPEAGDAWETGEKKRGVRNGGRVNGGRRLLGHCPESEAFAQLHLGRARADGQHCGAANTDEQRTEEHGHATCQRQSRRGTQDIADRDGGYGGLEEGKRVHDVFGVEMARL